MVDAVLFDLYDTLVTASWPRLARLWGDRLGVAGADIRLAFDKTRDARSRGHFDSDYAETAATAEACGVSPDSALVADLIAIEAEFRAFEVVAFTDTFPTLDTLRAKGVPTGIVSNCSRSTEAVVDRFGLREAVDVVVLSFEVGSMKPEPEIFRHAMTLLDVTSGLYVDDQVAYLDGAARVGLSTAQIVHSETRNSRPPSAGHEVVTSLAQLTARDVSRRS